MLHHHLLPVPGTGRERNIVYDAGDAIECLQRAGVDLVLSGHKHVPVRLAARGPVHRQRRHGLVAAPARATRGPVTTSSRSTSAHVDVWRKYPFHGQERIIQFSTETLAFEKYTTRIEDEVTARDVMRALALIDGEHYAPVVRDALAELPYEVVGALAGRRHGEAARRRGLRRAARRTRSRARSPSSSRRSWSTSPTSPCSAPRERFRLASRALALGLPYVGADFRFDPPPLAPFDAAVARVVGTGKRVGKTAVTGHVARLLARDRDVVVVAMGRGGPPEPEVVEAPPTLDDLLELSRAGRHAASDYLETRRSPAS